MAKGEFEVAKQEKIKLGALLLERRMLTKEQLDEALKSQMIFGGRLGTNLVELGYLDEEALAYFLSENLGVPYAHPKTLLDIDPSVIKLVPPNIAERYRVLPVGIKRKRLRLVMADPQDFEATKEISFVTGYVIEPMVTPELRLAQALEVHYGIARGARYKPLQDDNHKKKGMPSEEAPKAEQRETAPSVEIFSKKAGASVSTTRDKSAVKEGDEVSEEFIQEKVQKLREKRQSMLRVKKEHLKKEDSIKAHSHSDKAMELLGSAHDRNAVGKALLEYLSMCYPMGAILAVRGEMALGWCASSSPHSDEFVHKLRIPLNVPSILKKAIEEGLAIQSGPDVNPMDKMLRKIIKVEQSLMMVAAAVYYQKVTVCFLLAVAPAELFTDEALDELQSVAKEASKAFIRLIKPLQKDAT